MLFSTHPSILKNRFRPILALGLLSLTCLIAAPANHAVGQDLKPGSKAPALDIEHWVSDRDGEFSHITEFESGKVYVVEFWATWCGPCIASMPSLAKLQDDYADKGVQLISISSEKLETVEKFLDRDVRPSRGSKPDPDAEPMTYGELTSGYCLTTDPDRSVNNDYMKAAKRTGIPCAFIVGKTGLIEWIGHPMRIKEPLESVVDDSWDREAFAAETAFKASLEKMLKKTEGMASKGDVDGAIAKLDAFMETVPADHEDRSKLDLFRKALLLGSEGEVAVNTMNEIAELDDGMQILRFVATIISQGEDGREIDNDLAEATLKAADKALEISADDERTQGFGYFVKGRLLSQLGRFDDAITAQKMLLEINDSEMTRNLLEKAEKAKADAEADSEEVEPDSEEAKESPKKDAVEVEDDSEE